ncbi:MerR family transcriptional regulator [Cytobacillus horneckiae]|uniref:MerR family transcriptional regulator n=1 Tax=Cytobacillus horneckiae TaxID=549687 RepID=UPI0039A2FA7E
MNETNVKFFTTGEFAKLCKVNKQTLLYYDQIGLLSPVLKSDKGYRYYSIRQLELFNMIDLLKDLGMSLKEIQQYMQNKSPEAFLSLMYTQKEEIVKRRLKLEMNENIIDAKIKLMEEASYIDFHQITLEHFPVAALYLSKNIENIADDEFVEVVSDFIDELYVSQLDTGYPIGRMTKREQVINGEYTNYSYLYMEQPNPKKGYQYFQTVKGTFLVGYHIGEEQTIQNTYNKLFSKMKQLNFTLGEYVFEEYIYDMVVKNREEHYVTKIKIHVI